MKIRLFSIFLTIILIVLLSSCDEQGRLWLPRDISLPEDTGIYQEATASPVPTRVPSGDDGFIYDNAYKPEPPVIETDGCLVPAGEALVVRMKAANEGDRIYYTLDGTRPTSGSNIYTGPFTALGATDKTVMLTAISVNILGLASDMTGMFYQHPVVFKDPAVEAMIAEFLETEPGHIRYSMLNDIETIYVSGKVTSVNHDLGWIDDICFNPGDKTFSGSGSTSTGKGVIRYLDDFDLMPNLKHLIVNDCEIESIPDFRCITLETLSLMNNGIKDISPLKYPIGLDTLFLDNNEIEDVSELLGNINNIMYLSLSGNRLRECDFSESVSLLYLWLDDTGLASVPDLSQSRTIRYLDLSNNEIKDIDDMSYLYNLEFLNLSNNLISDLGWLEEKDSLEIYESNSNFTGSMISEIIGADGSGEMVIDMSGNNISDLSPLNRAYSVKKIYIRNNSVMIEPEMTEGLGSIEIIMN